MAKTKARVNTSSKSEIPAELWEYLEQERRIKAAAGSGFKASLANFAKRARSGEEQLANAIVSIILREPIDGSSAKNYESAGWDKIRLDSIEFVDGDGITFYPKGFEGGNPMIYVPWTSILFVKVK